MSVRKNINHFKVIRIILLFHIFFVLDLNAQTDTLYYDIEQQQISKINFKNKSNSDFYHVIRYATDTLVVEALMPNHLFGSLESKLTSQLFKIMSSRHQIDTLKTLSIYYIDTLRLKEEFPRKNLMTFRDSLGKILGVAKSSGHLFDGRKYYKKAQYHEISYNYTTFIKIHKSILKKHKRFKNVKSLFFYNYNKGIELEAEEINWYKDFGQLIKKIFNHEDWGFRHVVLKPNGEFYVQLGNSNISYKGLFKDKLWDINKKAYFNDINNKLIKN